jgi:pentatricopeptide repeat protein
MLAAGLQPNLVTFNTLLEVYAKQGMWREAIGVLDTLKQQVRQQATAAVAVTQGAAHSPRAPAPKYLCMLLTLPALLLLLLHARACVCARLAAPSCSAWCLSRARSTS